MIAEQALALRGLVSGSGHIPLDYDAIEVSWLNNSLAPIGAALL